MLIPVAVLMLLLLIWAGYGVFAQLLVVNSASQGARHGAALCAGQQPAEAVLTGARERALAILSPLTGPKAAGAELDGPDLLVQSTYTFAPPLPGARVLMGDGLIMRYTARYRCA